MKALYVFFSCVSILFAVGCSSNDVSKDTAADTEQVYVLDQTTSGPIKLDSFQCSKVSIRKGTYASGKMPYNRHFVHKGKDSITYSGVVYVTHKDPADKISYHSYQYYFKTAAGYSDVYVKYNTYSNELVNGEMVQKIATRENAWHLDFGYKNSPRQS